MAEWLWEVPGAGSGNRGGRDGDRSDGQKEGPVWTALPLGRPPEVGSLDRIRWAVVMAGALNPLRADLRPEAITRTACRVAASMVSVLPPAGRLDGREVARTPRILEGRARADSMAERLTARLSPAPSEPWSGA